MSKAINEFPPFESPDAANDAISGFCKAVTDARAKFGVQQVTVGMMVDVDYGGKQGLATAMTTHKLGSQFNDEALAAFIYGEAAAERRKMINLLASGKKAGNRQPAATMFDKTTAEE